jgi:hypothetical protein
MNELKFMHELVENEQHVAHLVTMNLLFNYYVHVMYLLQLSKISKVLIRPQATALYHF